MASALRSKCGRRESRGQAIPEHNPFVYGYCNRSDGGGGHLCGQRIAMEAVIMRRFVMMHELHDKSVRNLANYDRITELANVDVDIDEREWLIEQVESTISNDPECIMRNLYRDFTHGMHVDCTCKRGNFRRVVSCRMFQIGTPEEFLRCFRWNYGTAEFEFPLVEYDNLPAIVSTNNAQEQYVEHAAALVAFFRTAMPLHLISRCLPAEL
jgi:hypothetical protein